MALTVLTIAVAVLAVAFLVHLRQHAPKRWQPAPKRPTNRSDGSRRI